MNRFILHFMPSINLEEAIKRSGCLPGRGINEKNFPAPITSLLFSYKKVIEEEVAIFSFGTFSHGYGILTKGVLFQMELKKYRPITLLEQLVFMIEYPNFAKETPKIILGSVLKHKGVLRIFPRDRVPVICLERTGQHSITLVPMANSWHSGCYFLGVKK